MLDRLLQETPEGFVRFQIVEKSESTVTKIDHTWFSQTTSLIGFIPTKIRLSFQDTLWTKDFLRLFSALAAAEFEADQAASQKFEKPRAERRDRMSAARFAPSQQERAV